MRDHESLVACDPRGRWRPTCECGWVGLLCSKSSAETIAREHSVFALRAELAAARAQLPVGMEHCKILFRECALGHGWLTATNWVQHPCPTCELAAALALLKGDGK